MRVCMCAHMSWCCVHCSYKVIKNRVFGVVFPSPLGSPLAVERLSSGKKVAGLEVQNWSKVAVAFVEWGFVGALQLHTSSQQTEVGLRTGQ